MPAFLYPVFSWLGSALVSLFTALLSGIGTILVRGLSWGLGGIVAFAGITTVTYIGLQELIDFTLNKVQEQFAGLPLAVLQIAAILRIDDAIAIIFSAYVVRAAMAGILKAYKSISFFSWGKGS